MVTTHCHHGNSPSSISCCFLRFSDWANSSFSSWTWSESSPKRQHSYYSVTITHS